jgi:hypothetical protein
VVVAFRRHTLLPLHYCLYVLQPSIPHLTRSALHRCLQRHGISRLPDIEGDKLNRPLFHDRCQIGNLLIPLFRFHEPPFIVCVYFSVLRFFEKVNEEADRTRSVRNLLVGL